MCYLVCDFVILCMLLCASLPMCVFLSALYVNYSLCAPVCVCVCVCARARAGVCVHARVCVFSAFKACHPKVKSFYFAADGVDDMNR